MNIREKLLILLTLTCLNSFLSFAGLPAGNVLPVNLQCELRLNPMGVDISNPGLSYTLNAVHKADRGLRQMAYQILVASSAASLQQGNGDLWNPGKVMSDKMAYINYEGKPLASNQQCWWKVRVWNNNGQHFLPTVPDMRFRSGSKLLLPMMLHLIKQ